MTAEADSTGLARFHPAVSAWFARAPDLHRGDYAGWKHRIGTPGSAMPGALQQRVTLLQGGGFPYRRDHGQSILP
jgi:hypothetical protein